MKYDEFKERIENIWHAKFPNSMIFIEKLTGFSATWINIHPLLASAKTDLPYGLTANDMIKYRFSVSGKSADIAVDDGKDLPESLLLEPLERGYVVRPADRIYYCEYHKVYFRKTIGGAEKILSTFQVFTERLYNAIRDDMASGMIHENYMELVKKNVP